LDALEQQAAVQRIARDGDPDRYASALFAPPRSRAPLFALYAFNVELARIGEQVSEPQLGEIRLQWWREAMASSLAGEATGQPVADALGGAARQFGLSRSAIDGLIDARGFDILVKTMPDMAALETYLAKTAGAIFRLAAEITGGSEEVATLAPVARRAGFAYGLTGLMRALPLHLALGRIDVPADLLALHGVSPSSLLAGETSANFTALLAELRDNAKAALHLAVREVAALPAAARRAFLPLALVEPYLSALAKGAGWQQGAGIGPLYRLWRLGTYRFGGIGVRRRGDGGRA
jgi:15-cis-phytoene synthase